MPENEAFFMKPIQTQRASEAIYDEIKDMIVEQKLQPGDRLPSERSMMDMLHRSRSTIRESLRMLERAGLIKTVPGCRGAIVTELTLESVEQPLQNIVTLKNIPIEQLTEYRQATDTIFAAWAAQRRTGEDLDKLHGCLEEADAVTSDYRRFFAKDIEFHDLLAASSRNEIAKMVSSMMRTLIDNANTERYTGRSNEEMTHLCREIQRQHLRIFEAVKSGDSEAARQAMTDHLSYFGVNMAR